MRQMAAKNNIVKVEYDMINKDMYQRLLKFYDNEHLIL